jgi:hypothetical protein
VFVEELYNFSARPEVTLILYKAREKTPKCTLGQRKELCFFTVEFA